MRSALTLCASIVAAAALPTSAAGKQGTPLFESSDVIRISIKGPVGAVAGSASVTPRPASLLLGSETYPITIAARGLTRRKSETCQFPPLRVSFTQPPAKTSLFAGQKRLKLVTHCRGSANFQQYVLLEYAAYRMFNHLTPASFRARLAMIDYVADDGRPITTRYGFFLEDTDDLAKRNGVREAKVGDRVPVTSLSPAHAGRVAMFQHMIGNHDWSMIAGPKGAGCCHNGRLIGPVAPGQYAPVPYDFDFSGLVDAPYSAPPAQLPISEVRQRHYRGHCRHNAEAVRAAAEMRAAKPALIAILAATPGLEARTRKRGEDYLERFFADVATDQQLTSKVLKTCV